MAEVTINEEEARMASFLARMRHSSNRQKGVENDRRGPQSDEVTDLNGVLAEIAVAKYFNVWPSGAFQKGGADVNLKDLDVTIDVKATEYVDGHLIAKLEKKHKDHADIFMLAIIHKDDSEITVDLVGWIVAEELMRPEMEDYFGYGYVYAASQDDLAPVELIQKHRHEHEH